MSKFVLEKSPLFPYIAWTLIVCFSAFVFILVKDLEKTASEFSMYSENLEQETLESIYEINLDKTNENL